MATSATGTRKGRCITTTMEALFGRKDPALQLPREQVTEWLSLWIQNPGVREEARDTWGDVVWSRVAKGRQRWRFVPGPIHGLINTLLGAGV